MEHLAVHLKVQRIRNEIETVAKRARAFAQESG